MPTTDENTKPLKELLALTAPAGRTIICMGPLCWGKGETGAKAYAKARENYSSNYSHKPPLFIFFEYPADAYVDDMGGICWKALDVSEGGIELGRFRGRGGR